MKTLSRAGAAITVAALMTACGPPRQYGGMIHIDNAGLQTRLKTLERLEISNGATPAR